MTAPTTATELFAGHPETLRIYRAVTRALAPLEDVEEVVSRSQIAFRRHRTFAYLWRPGQYLRSEVPAVLSVALDERLTSPRFKEVAHPSPRVWMHHLELSDPAQVDQEVHEWLSQAWRQARPGAGSSPA